MEVLLEIRRRLETGSSVAKRKFISEMEAALEMEVVLKMEVLSKTEFFRKWEFHGRIEPLEYWKFHWKSNDLLK